MFNDVHAVRLAHIGGEDAFNPRLYASACVVAGQGTAAVRKFTLYHDFGGIVVEPALGVPPRLGKLIYMSDVLTPPHLPSLALSVRPLVCVFLIP